MKKWLNWIALVIVFAVACGFLANWQFSRRETKLSAIALVQLNYGASPLGIGELIENSRFALPLSTWKKVKVSGHYLPQKTLLVRNRPNNGQPGFEELVPFMTESNGIIFISRGWLPSGEKQDYPDDVILPDGGLTTVVGHVLPAEPIINRSAPKGQIATINPLLAAKISTLRISISNGYLRAVSESPNVGKKLIAMPAPTTEEGNNLSYAMQWILFAMMAAGALIWRIRKDRDTERGIISNKKLRQSDFDAQFEDETTTEI